MMSAEEENTLRGWDREANVPRDLYFSDHYFSYEQLWSLAEQIRRIYELKPSALLEIGVGNGFVATYLRSAGMRVTTFDINANLSPDIVAPLSEIEAHVKPGDYDLIACCEVLEHLPFDQFGDMIERFSRLAPNLYLTLPNAGKKFGWGGLLRIPHVHRWFSAWCTIPSRTYEMTPEHFWEIGFTPETHVREIMRVLSASYADVEKGYMKANPYHRYFICRSRT